jgi:hypothetical protein
MVNAPPVVYPVGRFAEGRLLFVAVCVLSAVGLLSWQMQTLVTGFKLWAAWGLWVACAGSAALWAPRQTFSGGRLGWSGEAWFWQAHADLAEQTQAVAVSVGLDTGQGLLLWVQPLDEQGGRAQGRLRSAWLQAGAMPSKWHGFRCAVYSRPKTVAMSDGRPQERV